MTWRIYRLPGSREWLHIDSGHGTTIINVLGFEIFAPSHWGQNCGAIQPRGWIEVETDSFFVVDGIAMFFNEDYKQANESVSETLRIIDAAKEKEKE